MQKERRGEDSCGVTAHVPENGPVAAQTFLERLVIKHQRGVLSLCHQTFNTLFKCLCSNILYVVIYYSILPYNGLYVQLTLYIFYIFFCHSCHIARNICTYNINQLVYMVTILIGVKVSFKNKIWKRLWAMYDSVY